MATAVVSGRVDVAVKNAADAIISARGLTPADVIKAVWERIAATGEVPGSPEYVDEDQERSRKLLAELKELSEQLGDNESLVNMTDDEMKDLVASKYA